MLDADHPDPSRWWRNRRWQAWASLAGIFGLALAAIMGWVPEHTLPLAQSIVWVLAGIVAVYSGGASVVDAMTKMRGAKQ